MNFNKCERCGSFFATNSDVCPRCAPKDQSDINKLKNFLENSDTNISINNMVSQTGITSKNLSRYFSTDKLGIIEDCSNSNYTTLL